MTSNEQTVGYRLSRQQERLWRLREQAGEELRPLRARLLLEGPLDVERLQEAFSRVVSRHEALRTRFEMVPGVTLPIQVIGEAATLTGLRDLRQVATDAKQ